MIANDEILKIEGKQGMVATPKLNCIRPGRPNGYLILTPASDRHDTNYWYIHPCTSLTSYDYIKFIELIIINTTSIDKFTKVYFTKCILSSYSPKFAPAKVIVCMVSTLAVGQWGPKEF